MSKSRLVVLGLTAILILALGLRFRPADPQESSESAAAQLLTASVTAGDADDFSDFFAKRAGELARFTAYSDSLGASTLVWNDTISVATSSSAPLLVYPRSRIINVRDSLSPSRNRKYSGWTILVGRNAADSAIWTVTLRQGSATTECAGQTREELVLGGTPGRALAGAGVFASDGTLAGVVIDCGDRLAAIARSSIETWITENAERSARLTRDSLALASKKKRR